MRVVNPPVPRIISIVTVCVRSECLLPAPSSSQVPDPVSLQATVLYVRSAEPTLLTTKSVYPLTSISPLALPSTTAALVSISMQWTFFVMGALKNSDPWPTPESLIPLVSTWLQRKALQAPRVILMHSRSIKALSSPAPEIT